MVARNDSPTAGGGRAGNKQQARASTIPPGGRKPNGGVNGHIGAGASPTHSQAVEFLLALRPAGPWLLTAIVPDGPTTTVTATSPQQVDSFVAKYDGRRNLYYSVNPTRTALTSKAAKTDIASVEYLMADLDPAKGESPKKAKARYFDALGKRQPTAIVDSGNGLQALWRLAQPVILPEPATTTDGKKELSPEGKKLVGDIEARSKALMESLGSVAGTQNIDRILRLPGTTNLPNETKRKVGRVPCPTALIQFSDATFPLAAFDTASADTEPAGKSSHKASAKASRSSAAGTTGDTPDVDYVVKTGDATHWKGDRSRAVWFVVNERLRQGVPHDDIVKMLLNPDNGISAHVYDQSNPRQYAQEQVDKAAEKAAKEAANYPPVERVEITPGAGDGDPALWTMYFAGGGKLNISSHDVFSQRTFLRQCLAELGRRYATRKEVAYATWVDGLATSAERIEPPAGVSAEDEFHDWLEDYLTQYPRGNYVRPKEDMHMGIPWLDEENGRYLFVLRHLQAFLVQQGSRFGQESLPRLGKRIRDPSVGGRFFKTSVGTKSIGVFAVPSAPFHEKPAVPHPTKKEVGI